MIRKILVAAVFLAAALVAPLSAQTPPPTRPAGPGGFDPASIRASIFARFKTALESNDDEWKLLEPKIAKIFLLQLDVTMLPNMRCCRGPGGGAGGFRGMI